MCVRRGRCWAGPRSWAVNVAAAGARRASEHAIASPAAIAAPSSSQRRNSCAAICFGRRISSGVWACVHTISGSAIAFRRQPVAMRSIWRAQHCGRRCRRRSGSHGPAVDPVQRRVVGPVEEVLHHPETAARFSGVAKEVAVGRQHVGRTGGGMSRRTCTPTSDAAPAAAAAICSVPPVMGGGPRAGSSSSPVIPAAIVAVGDHALTSLPRAARDPRTAAPQCRRANRPVPRTASEATRPRPSRFACSSRRAAAVEDVADETICRRRSPSSPAVTPRHRTIPAKPRHDAEVPFVSSGTRRAIAERC